MADIFQVTPRQTAKPSISRGKEDITSRYATLQGEFLSSSYGYYATHFVQKIAAEAVARSPQTEVLSIIKLLRELVRKFLLSDLQLVFVGYVAGQLEWSFGKPFYRQRNQILGRGTEQLHKGVQVLNYFLHLCACFVKNYIGQLEEATAISDLLNMEMGSDWQIGYEEWLKTIPSQLFKLSPRAINGIFRTYSRDCLKSVQSKNYNSMVDRILELSTTYSMIPGEAKQKKKQQMPQIFEESSSGRKLVKKNVIAEGNISKRESSINEGAVESRLSNNFFEPKPKELHSESKQPPKRGLLKLRTKNQQVSNHITEFYSKKQYQTPAGREQFRPQSTIGFQNSIPSLLDFNNRSSVYQAIPYTLRNNSNLSNFWK